jgi:hypothetical protein
MTSKGLNKNLNLFEALTDSDRDVFKATVKITTFSSKEEKWVSYEETHINRGRQITSLKSSSTKTSESGEGLDLIESKSKILIFIFRLF